jgi:hypothetical protein
VKESSKFELLSNLNGGLSTRPTPLLVEAGKKMQSPDLKNVNFFKTGGISKRLGKAQEGDTLTASAAFSQAGTTTYSQAGDATEGLWLFMPFTTGGTVTLGSVEFQIAAANTGLDQISYTAQIWSNAAGLPNASLGQIGQTDQPSSTTPTSLTLTGGTVALSAGTVYWIALHVENSQGPALASPLFTTKRRLGTLARFSVNAAGAAPYT